MIDNTVSGGRVLRFEFKENENISEEILKKAEELLNSK